MTMRGLKGVKVVDHVLDTMQIDWLLISKTDCPNPEEEHRLISSHFRKPHDPWGAEGAFVTPVSVRYGRNRILFRQESGLTL